jgi:hypothetical protein
MPPVAIFGRSLASGKTGAKSGDGANEFISGSVLAHPPKIVTINAPHKKSPDTPKVFLAVVDLDDRAVMVFIR